MIPVLVDVSRLTHNDERILETLPRELPPLFEPSDALLDLVCDLFDLRHIGVVQVVRQLGK